MGEEHCDWEKLEEVALALLSLATFEDGSSTRAWKGLDWGLLDRLHGRGWIHDPKGKAKSVVLTEEGQAKALEFFGKHFQGATEPDGTEGPPQSPAST